MAMAAAAATTTTTTTVAAPPTAATTKLRTVMTTIGTTQSMPVTGMSTRSGFKHC